MKPIRLETAFKAGFVKRGDFVEYLFPINKVELTTEQTGWNETQVFYTEQAMKWRLDNYNGRQILVAEDATEQELILKGMTGHDKGPSTMNYKCKKLYLNNKLAIGVVAMNIEIFEQLAECNRLSPTRQYWLGSPYINTYAGRTSFGLRYVNSGFVGNYILYYSNGYTYALCFGVRPVVFLKSDLVVVAGTGTEEDPWKLDEVSFGYWDSNGEFQFELEKLLKSGITIEKAMESRILRVGDYILYPHSTGNKKMRLAYHQGEIILFEEETRKKKKVNIGGIITVNQSSILLCGRGTKNNPWVIRT